MQEVTPVTLATLDEFLTALEGDGVKPAECVFVTLDGGVWEQLKEGLAASPFAESELITVTPELAEPAGRIALHRFDHGQTGDALTVNADYVRRSDAELLWKPK